MGDRNTGPRGEGGDRQPLGPAQGLPLGLEVVIAQAVLERLQDVVVRQHVADGELQLGHGVGDRPDVVLVLVQHLDGGRLLLAAPRDAHELLSDLEGAVARGQGCS